MKQFQSFPFRSKRFFKRRILTCPLEMMFRAILFQVAFCAAIFTTVHRCEAASDDASDESSTRVKRAEPQIPVLSMTIDFVNVTDYLRHGDHYGYTTTLKHSEGSMAHAVGVHVIWMLASFTRFLNLVSFSGPKPPKIVHRDDSVTFKMDELTWGIDFTFSFKVEFDPEKSLKPADYSVVTPVQLIYYDVYSENSEGEVLSKGRYFSPPLDKVVFNIELPGCSEALGMKSKKINDYQVMASSSYAESQPSQARETDDAWCAYDQDENQFIQVDFLLKTRVTRVGTLRRAGKDHFVKEYILQYSDDDFTWTDYMENGHIKVFKGPQIAADTEMIVHFLRHPIEANSIRLRPKTWFEQICLRMELYGCDILGSPARCISPLGLESGEIKDEALSHSLSSSSNSKPQFIRLNLKIEPFPWGWYVSSTGSVDYLQIDFGTLRKVTGIATMGGYEVIYYVASFKLEYSKNGLTWVKYRENGEVKDVSGPQSSYEAKFAVLSKLTEPFVARYMRIFPNDIGSVMKTMRAEIYGCFAEELPPYNDATEYARRSFLLDPVTDRFFACMYTDEKTESSCFSTVDGVEWTVIEPFIISITASNPTLKELYGLDRKMNFHKSCDSGDTWRQITDGYIKEIQRETSLIGSTPLPENIVSEVPTANLIAVANSTGVTWGVSGSGIHMMTAGNNHWSMVGSWKCCGM